MSRLGPSPLDEQGRPLVRMRKQGNPAKGHIVYALTVPAAMCRALPDAFLDGRYFSVEFTDEGILFRPTEAVAATNQRPPVPPPKWAA